MISQFSAQITVTTVTHLECESLVRLLDLRRRRDLLLRLLDQLLSEGVKVASLTLQQFVHQNYIHWCNGKFLVYLTYRQPVCRTT